MFGRGQWPVGRQGRARKNSLVSPIYSLNAVGHCHHTQTQALLVLQKIQTLILKYHLKKKRKKEINLISNLSDPTVVGGDTLTCGECKKDFRLQELTLFIQHKALNSCRYFISPRQTGDLKILATPQTKELTIFLLNYLIDLVSFLNNQTLAFTIQEGGERREG